jgi:hypothetical protein
MINDYALHILGVIGVVSNIASWVAWVRVGVVIEIQHFHRNSDPVGEPALREAFIDAILVSLLAMLVLALTLSRSWGLQ